MAEIIKRTTVAEELLFDDGGVGIELGNICYKGYDTADLIALVDKAIIRGWFSEAMENDSPDLKKRRM